MPDIIHRVGIKAPIAEVYKAVSTIEGVSGWWTEDTSGNSAVGGIIKVKFNTPDGKEVGGMEMEVTALEPNKKVQWRFKAGPDEWVGTDAIFDLYQADEYTIVLFTHKDWREVVEFMYHCSMKWGTFLLSLREYAETGKGKPSPNDIKIDNWN